MIGEVDMEENVDAVSSGERKRFVERVWSKERGLILCSL